MRGETSGGAWFLPLLLLIVCLVGLFTGGCTLRDCGFAPDINADEGEVVAGVVYQCSF